MDGRPSRDLSSAVQPSSATYARSMPILKLDSSEKAWRRAGRDADRADRRGQARRGTRGATSAGRARVGAGGACRPPAGVERACGSRPRARKARRGARDGVRPRVRSRDRRQPVSAGRAAGGAGEAGGRTKASNAALVEDVTPRSVGRELRTRLRRLSRSVAHSLARSPFSETRRSRSLHDCGLRRRCGERCGRQFGVSRASRVTSSTRVRPSPRAVER
jgi:hypothetical protein